MKEISIEANCKSLKLVLEDDSEITFYFRHWEERKDNKKRIRELLKRNLVKSYKKLFS